MDARARGLATAAATLRRGCLAAPLEAGLNPILNYLAQSLGWAATKLPQAPRLNKQSKHATNNPENYEYYTPSKSEVAAMYEESPWLADERRSTSSCGHSSDKTTSALE